MQFIEKTKKRERETQPNGIRTTNQVRRGIEGSKAAKPFSSWLVGKLGDPQIYWERITSRFRFRVNKVMFKQAQQPIFNC